MGHKEILGEMIDRAKLEQDLPAETLSLSLAFLLSDPAVGLDDETRELLMRLGAALWRHSARFAEDGEGQTRQ